MRFPRINRIRTDKPAHEADTIDNLLKLLGPTGVEKPTEDAYITT